MRTVCFEGTVTALTSISHIGDSYGVTAKLRREKIVQPDGSVEEIPILSGNGVRGILRDRGMLHLCRELGFGVNDENGEVQGLSKEAFYLLFSGGALSKQGGARGLDIDEARRWRELIPLLSVFGGAVGNQIMPGKLKCGKLIPIVSETQHLLPERFRVEAPVSIWNYCQEEAYTRRDDEKNEHLRMLIAPAERKAIEDAARKDRAVKPADKAPEETGIKQQMRYYLETLAAGTSFFWEVSLDDVSDLEFEAFVTCLVEFSRFPYLGGKSNIGHGKVKIAFDSWLSVDPTTCKGAEVDTPLGNKYLKHLQVHGEEIREVLHAIT